MFVKVFCVLVFVSQCVVFADEESQHVIGGIFFADEADDLEAALSVSAAKYSLGHTVMRVSRRGNILEISEQICTVANQGVIGIIDGLGGRSSEHVQAVCDILELPHVIIQPNDFYSKNWSMLSLYPSTEVYNNVVTEIITGKEWDNFTLLYIKGHSLRAMETLLQMGNFTDKSTISVRELDGDNYRDVLINARGKSYCNFVVDCPSDKLEQILRHAQQVGLMADEHSYIFLSPDLFTLDLSRYRYGGVNMTGLRLVDLKKNFLLWEFTAELNEIDNRYNPEDIKTRVVLIHDAVKIFYEALNKIGLTNSSEYIIQPESLSCEDYRAWSYGSTFLNFMKTNTVPGITGMLSFDGFGQRNDVTFDVLELTPSGNQSIGEWSSNKLNMHRPFLSPSDISEETIMSNRTFIVLIALTAPYAFMKKSLTKLDGNDQYEGFAIDLIDALAKDLGFNYKFEVEGTYGARDPVDKTKWTGMIKRLIEETADFGICDFTITVERQQGIDFSTPFMSLGIGILYKEPSKQPPEMFSFMAVFSKEVWLYMVFVQLSIGVVMIFVGRISHKEWQNPVPCIEQPEELRNQFSFANSVWLIIGSVMQQGSEIAPIALAPRMITSFWWFFTMVIMASYVGTLVAFLTVEKNVLPFQTLEELAEQKSISYGCKEVGSTVSFFNNPRNPLLKSMYDNMKNHEGWLMKENDDGIEKAETSNYAFFTESTTIEYYKERHCDLLQIGDLLDSKSYGIGMKKGSPFKKYIDNSLLKLKEQGEIQRLKDLWWKEKRGGGKCGVKKEEEAKQLGMKNLLGAFVVLGFGCGFGLFVSILDMLWGVFKRSVKYKTTFKYELIEELKFIVKFSDDVKPVKRPKSTDEGSGSEEALANADAAVQEEAKDDLGSLRSARTIRSGRSTSTRRSSHSHCSRHSPSELSVAFARRRVY